MLILPVGKSNFGFGNTEVDEHFDCIRVFRKRAFVGNQAVGFALLQGLPSRVEGFSPASIDGWAESFERVLRTMGAVSRGDVQGEVSGVAEGYAIHFGRGEQSSKVG